MAPHSSTLAWKIPWMEEPGSLQSMGSQKAGHDGATSLFFSFMILICKKSKVMADINLTNIDAENELQNTTKQF